VYVVEQLNRTSNPNLRFWFPIFASEEAHEAKDACRDWALAMGNDKFRVVPYDRVPNARPLLVVKGSRDAG